LVGSVTGGRASFSGSYVRNESRDAPINGNGIMPDIVEEPSVNDDDHDAVVFVAAATLRQALPTPE